MPPKYLFLIIASIGCATAVPFDQLWTKFESRDRSDSGSRNSNIPGVIPLEELLQKNSNRNVNHNSFYGDYNQKPNPSLGNLDKAPETVDFAPKLLSLADLQNSPDDSNADSDANGHVPGLNLDNLSYKNEESHDKTVESSLPHLQYDELNSENEADYKNVNNQHLPKLDLDDSSIKHEENHKKVNYFLPIWHQVTTESPENHEIEDFFGSHELKFDPKNDYQHIGKEMATPYGVSEPKLFPPPHKKLKSSKNNAIPESIDIFGNESSDNKKIGAAPGHESSGAPKKSEPSLFNSQKLFNLERENDSNSPEKLKAFEHKSNQSCPNARNKSHITKIFASNMSSLPFEDDLNSRFDPESSKSSKIYVGEDVTVCWTEITTIKENKLLASPNRQVIREYAISFENSATIPDEYLECSKMPGEISDNKRVCDSKFPSTIDQDTRKSRVINTTTKTREGDLDVTQIKLIKCGVGSLVTREVFKTGKNDSKRIEIKVSPLTKKPEGCDESQEAPKVVLKSYKPDCPEDICNVKNYDDEGEDDEALSTGVWPKVVSSTQKLEDLVESENVSCSGVHCPGLPSTVFDSTTKKIGISSPESLKTSTLLVESVTKSLEALESGDLKLNFQTTTPDDSGQDYSEPGSGDCSEEIIADDDVAVEPNDNHVRINKASFDLLKVPSTIIPTEPTTIDRDRKLLEPTSTSGIRKSTPIHSSTAEAEKGEKHKLSLKIRVSLEQIDDDQPHKIADIEKNLTLDQPLSGLRNLSLMQQLETFNKSADNLEAIKEILNCSLLNNFSKDISSSEKSTYRRESEQAFDKLIDNAADAIDSHNGAGVHESGKTKSKRSVEGIEKLGSWSDERFMKLQSGGELHSFTQLTLFRDLQG